MPRAVLLGFIVLGLAAAQTDAESWRVYRSPHFELMTSAPAAEARAALSHIEAVRAQVAAAEPWLAPPAGRVRILAFSSEKEFGPYRSSSQSPAYFASGPEGDLIVLGRLTKDQWPLLAHEYMHAALRAAGVRLPHWLEEGLAELYSGRPAPPRRLQPRIGPPEFIALESAAPTGPLRSSGSSDFYRQSRILAHLLRHHPGYAPRWPALLLRASAGSFSTLLPALYDRSLQQVARDATRFRLPYPTAPVPAPAEVDHRALQDEEHRWHLALALSRLGRTQQALGHLEGLDTARAHALAAKLLLQTGSPAARERLRRAFDLGARDEYTLWQLVCLEQDHPASTYLLPALERLLEAHPGRDDARLILASHYLSRGLFEAARRHLSAVREVPPEHAAYFDRALRLTGLA